MKFQWFIFWVWAGMAGAMTPEAAVREALAQSRELAAVQWRISEAQGRLVQAGLWSNPELMAGVESDLVRPEGRGELWSVGLMQRFPLAGRLEKGRAVARVDVAMAREEWLEARRKLAGEVLRQARKLLVMERRLALNRENRALLGELSELAAAQVAAGRSSAGEVGMIAVEEAALELSAATLEMERESLQIELASLLGGRRQRVAITGGWPSLPSAAALAKGTREVFQKRPDWRLAVLAQDRSRAEVALARSKRWEAVGVGLELMREPEMEATTVGVKVSLPLPLWDRQQGEIASAKASHQRALEELAARKVAVESEVREAAARLQRAMAIAAKARGPALEKARGSSRLLLEAYANGSLPFVNILESRKQQLELEAMALEADERFLEALSDWQTRTGRVSAALE